MNNRTTFFLTFGFLILLIILQFFRYNSFSDPSVVSLLITEIVITLIVLVIMIWLYNDLRKEKKINRKYKKEVEDLFEAGKSIKRELDKSEERKNFLADAIPQIVWETDEHGKVVYFNSQWYKYTGLSVEESMNNLWMLALHNDDRPRTSKVWEEAVKAGTTHETEFRVRNARGEYEWFLDRGLPMKDEKGRIVKWFGTCTIIEDQKNQRLLLESKIKERTNQLEELNNELTRSNKELENFAYIASHDLQEPLRKIRAFGDILKKKFTEMLPDQGKEYIDRMQHASYRMQKLIDDLLNYSRVSRNAPSFETVDLSELANEVVDDLETIIREKNASIRFRDLPKMYGDKRQLKQLFQNLISNGIKFHKENENPVVEIKPRFIDGRDEEIHLDVINGRSLELIFSDNGIGFDEKYKDKIFTIFQRLHGRNEYEGTGIGLAICKKIVENHKGNIYARSHPGQGAEFIVIFPEQTVSI